MKRVILLVMDSVGIGSAADASEFGGEGFTDEGANTLGRIAAAFARGEGENGRTGPLHLPHLDRLGLGHAVEASCGEVPAGLAHVTDFITADHGNDPTWPGTDHTREHIPILLRGDAIVPGTNFGGRETFADIGQTIADYFALPPMDYGTSMLR